MTLTKQERIELRKKEIGGDRRERKREVHTDKFNKMFKFFFLIIRKGICDFCGSDVGKDYHFIQEVNGVSAKTAFKISDTGTVENYTIKTRHPNILKVVIKGKRGWGLWKTQFAMGVADNTFTKKEILDYFSELKIDIPKPYLIEFENEVWNLRDEDDMIDILFKLKLYDNLTRYNK